ncbi:DUF389 domain-containing protein [Psychrobacter sp. AOP22-C1-22]|uniref:DUF389 domain-containing protein n=1 Tax=unclassified Psychrobacter TaxID=196806 RepID=UPI001CE4AD14|nr:DUF389 domain-containing protein [Psychrobacter sp. FME6]
MTSPEKNHSNEPPHSKGSSGITDYSDQQAALVNADRPTQKQGKAILDNADALEHPETDDESELDEDMAGAQPPETTIAIESLGSDEVVATLETSKPEAQPTNENAEYETLESDESFFQEKMVTATEMGASTENSVETDSTDTANTHPSTQQSSPTIQAQESSVDAAIPSHNNLDEGSQESLRLENTSEQENVASDEELSIAEQNNDTAVKDKLDEQENQEEEVQEQKEAKLESYKQFVAEQFSNQKVDYPEVRVRIEANALPSKMYFIMNILSAIIASYGLVTNSAAVVIGAMLVAMMLGPITGIALAIIDHRMPLLRKSLITVIIGISLVVVVGFIVGWLHKDQPLTAEILSRTQPTSMDLMIALAGGTAGAYAMVSPHLSVAVVGVAVATALVPPLAASGILFANGEMQLGLGALLLALTNIIAIQFTNALVLWLLGFRRLVDDDYKSSTYLTFLRRNAVTLLLLSGLGAYLTINLQTNAKQQVFESSVKEAINSYFNDKGNVLTNTQFDTGDENQVVRAVIRGETTPSSYDVQQIEMIITQDMTENFPDYLPIKLQLRYLPVQVIESNPLIQDKLDKTDAAILTN